MATTLSALLLSQIDSSHLAYQCAGPRERRVQEGSGRGPGATHRHARDLPDLHAAARREGPANCPTCGGGPNGGRARLPHRAAHRLRDTKNPMIGLVGAKGSGKTVLMTVLVQQLRK